jgi:hypothetical protein
LKAILMAVLVAVGPLAIAAEPGDDDDPYPSSISGDHLLESVISSFPATPVQITGTLHVRKRRGVVVETLGLDIAAEWSKERTHATYTIRDQAGRALDSMQVIREGDQPVEFRYQRAGTPQPPPTPAFLSSAIHASDVSWTDLTLAFLWWRGSTIVGEDSVKGYDCTIVEVPAPANEAFHYRKARLWIAKRAPVLLKAEGLDAEGKTVRRLWVENFKKQGETWMVKDMEFQHYPIRHRTKLRVRKLELATP